MGRGIRSVFAGRGQRHAEPAGHAEVHDEHFVAVEVD
jgi:hypothetical protein